MSGGGWQLNLFSYRRLLAPCHPLPPPIPQPDSSHHCLVTQWLLSEGGWEQQRAGNLEYFSCFCCLVVVVWWLLWFLSAKTPISGRSHNAPESQKRWAVKCKRGWSPVRAVKKKTFLSFFLNLWVIVLGSVGRWLFLSLSWLFMTLSTDVIQYLRPLTSKHLSH